MGVLGGVFVLKSGLRILIRAPQVPFLVPPKTPKMTHFFFFLSRTSEIVIRVDRVIRLHQSDRNVQNCHTLKAKSGQDKKLQMFANMPYKKNILFKALSWDRNQML